MLRAAATRFTMLRTVIFLAAALVVLAGGGDVAAQDAWPAYTSGLPDPHAIARGPGSYIAPWKLVLLLVLVWIWVKSADWVGRQPDEMGDAIGMPGKIWNPVMVFGPLVGFLLAVTIPIFLAGWGAMLLMYVVPFAIYV